MQTRTQSQYGSSMARQRTVWNLYACKYENTLEYEVEGSRPRGRPKRTWREVVQKDCQGGDLNKEDGMDCGRWKKLIKTG